MLAGATAALVLNLGVGVGVGATVFVGPRAAPAAAAAAAGSALDGGNDPPATEDPGAAVGALPMVGVTVDGAATANVAAPSFVLNSEVHPGAYARSPTVYVPSAALGGTCHVTGNARCAPGVKLWPSNHFWNTIVEPPGP
jgi:hypothetical protein